MENNRNSWIRETQTFGEGKRHYFFDIKTARNNSSYLQISRSVRVDEDKYERSRLVVFEEDLAFFVEALSMLLSNWSHKELKKCK